MMPVSAKDAPAASVAVALVVLVLAAWGLFVAPLSYVMSCLVFALVVLVLESDRRIRLAGVSWWVTGSLVLPWGALVILPWTMWLAYDGPWRIGMDFLATKALPLTWTLNLVALVGLALGTLLGSRRTRPAPDLPSYRVSGYRFLIALSAVLGVYLVSFLVAGRPFTALWRLGGDVLYADNVDAGVRLGFLDLAPNTAIGLVLVVAAFRRRHRVWPTSAEAIALAATLLLTLGSGSRSRIFLLVFGWVLIQLGTGVSRRTSLATKIGTTGFLIVLSIAAFYAISYISIVREGQSTADVNSVERGIISLDVIGMEELLVSRGAQLGVLGGVSYTELPNQFVPRRFTSQEKPLPAAQRIVNTYLDARAGFSTPYWFESALNLGLPGVFVVSSLLAAILVRIQIVAAASRCLTLRAVSLIGPSVMLVSYQFLCRLLTFQLLTTAGSLLLGAWLAVRCRHEVKHSNTAVETVSSPKADRTVRSLSLPVTRSP